MSDSKVHSHRDARNYLDRKDRARRNWIRTTCKVCGAFIGYRPADLKKRTKPVPYD